MSADLPPNTGRTKKSAAPHWSDRFTRGIRPETLAAHPWLKPVAHRLEEPALWRFQHEAVARGVAIGLFWAFALPAGQILVAAAHSVWWRANIPVAAGITLITNPFTIGFWLWLAYQLGSLILGMSAEDAAVADAAYQAAAAAPGFDAMAWLAHFGWPAVLGMGIFSIAGSIGAYFLVKLIWRLRIQLKRRDRRRRR